MCKKGQHKPIHRGILGGYFCGYCGAFDYDGLGDWQFVPARFPRPSDEAAPEQSDDGATG